jgi:predicted PurR-regulated permease PerM
LGAANAVIRKHWRLSVFVLGVLLVFWLLWVLRSVLLPFIVGFVLAYLILPVVRWAERRLPGAGKRPQLKRISILVTVYAVSLGVLGLLIFYVATLVSRALGGLTQGSQIIPDGVDAVARLLKSSPVLSNPSIQHQIDVYSANAVSALPGVMSDFLTRGVKIVQSSAGAVLGFIIMPVFVFFLLKDWDRLRDRFYAALPPWTRAHTEAIFVILQNAVVRYIRGQLILGLAVGLLVYAMLMILRVSFALPLAVFAAAMELVPTIGPWLSGALAVLVCLATAPEKVGWVALGYLLIQLLENQVLGPRIQSTQMHIHPAFLLMLGVLGAHFAGILGFIIVLPLTMIVINILKYVRDNISPKPENAVGEPVDQLG